MFAVPWPLATVTLETPVPGVADQLKMLLSSLPVRLTSNGAAFCSTVVIGLAGALIDGGLFVTVHEFAGVAEFRGDGAAMVKSVELLSVSVHPAPLRMAALVLVSGAVAAPSKQLAPSYPMKS